MLIHICKKKNTLYKVIATSRWRMENYPHTYPFSRSIYIDRAAKYVSRKQEKTATSFIAYATWRRGAMIILRLEESPCVYKYRENSPGKNLSQLAGQTSLGFSVLICMRSAT